MKASRRVALFVVADVLVGVTLTGVLGRLRGVDDGGVVVMATRFSESFAALSMSMVAMATGVRRPLNVGVVLDD
jgi:hypothetical protein